MLHVAFHVIIELNLRRNIITHMDLGGTHPTLCKLWLSHNAIASFASIASLFQMKNLTELALDGYVKLFVWFCCVFVCLSLHGM